jgi:small subunit ribosomal protein S16
MATRIRLQRHGKKGKPFFHLVAADSRAKRDGKFIEKLGTYNPNTNPATIEINFDRTLHWVQVGAEMTETARALLAYKGILYKNHLANGVKKGAFSAEEAETRYTTWAAEKENKITAKVEGLGSAGAKDKATRFAAETAVKEAKAKAIAAKNAPVVEEVVEEEIKVTSEETETPEAGESTEEKSAE